MNLAELKETLMNKMKGGKKGKRMTATKKNKSMKKKGGKKNKSMKKLKNKSLVKKDKKSKK
jgi:hypothetical protein